MQEKSSSKQNLSHVVLTSHPGKIFRNSPNINWGAKTGQERGPIIGSLTTRSHRNAIGTHGGSYSVYRALATAMGAMKEEHRPDLTNTTPVINIGPFPSWSDPEKMVALDPWGAGAVEFFSDYLEKGYDIRPTIAVTKAHLTVPEITQAIEAGRIPVDGKIVTLKKDVSVTKVAVDPVWYLPGIAKRLSIEEGDLRRILYEQTAGMFPELITRPDLKVMLPPIGSTSVYLFGDISTIPDPNIELTLRIHDECNGSDVFGSDICTCRPYLTHGIEEAVKTAQRGGAGAVIYYRKEGRALGEVTKFLVYNARKRQEGGDNAATYFRRTECVAGVQDMRFQELMPDVMHWLGITRIHNLVSMSDMKYNAITKSGIEVLNRVSIPAELIPTDAWVEMEAKKAAGYYSPEKPKDEKGLKSVKGRSLDE